MKSLRATPAITYVLHLAISIFVGAVWAAIIVVGQKAFVPGASIQNVWGAALIAFSTWFTGGFVALAKNPQLAQAEADGIGEVKGIVTDLATSHSTLVSMFTQFLNQFFSQNAAVQPPPQQVQPPMQNATTQPQVQFQPQPIQYNPSNTSPYGAIPK